VLEQAEGASPYRPPLAGVVYAGPGLAGGSCSQNHLRRRKKGAECELVEKVLPRGELVGRVAGGVLMLAGLVLLGQRWLT
jgi:hypothetical protein